MALQELAARLNAGRVSPPRVETAERLTANGESRREIRIAARVTGAEDELAAIPLHAHRGVGALTPDGKAKIVRAADARFDEELRHACGEQ